MKYLERPTPPPELFEAGEGHGGEGQTDVLLLVFCVWYDSSQNCPRAFTRRTAGDVDGRHHQDVPLPVHGSASRQPQPHSRVSRLHIDPVVVIIF